MALTNAKTQDFAVPALNERLGEFDRVRLLEDLPADAGVLWLDDDHASDHIVAGATGAIVHAHGEDGPFEVEFTEPVTAVATVRKEQLSRD